MLKVHSLPTPEILGRFAARYPEADIDKVLSFLTLMHVSDEISQRLDTFLADFGLLQSRWWILILLMREADLTLTPSALAEKAGVSRATMTGLLDGLIRDGMVSRIHNAADRRSVGIQLTACGQAKLDEVMPVYYREVSQLMGVIQKAERAQLMKILSRLHEASTWFGAQLDVFNP